MDSAADKTFFSARKWLEYAYRYARALRLSPYGLVGVMLARMSALTPPNVVAQLTPHDMPMTLNVNVALVGPTGSGKGRTMGQARHLMPSPPLCMLEEVKPKTGESIPAKFVAKVPATDGDGKPIKGEYMDKVMTDRCLLLMPEVVSLKAAMSRQGSIILPTLLESFSNEPLGDDTKGKQFQIKLPPYAYRLAAVVGVQPNNAGVLFDEAQTGLAGRFAYMPSVDTDAPSRRPEPPTGVFPYDPCVSRRETDWTRSPPCLSTVPWTTCPRTGRMRARATRLRSSRFHPPRRSTRTICNDSASLVRLPRWMRTAWNWWRDSRHCSPSWITGWR